MDDLDIVAQLKRGQQQLAVGCGGTSRGDPKTPLMLPMFFRLTG